MNHKDYFLQERIESVVFVGLGAIAVGFLGYHLLKSSNNYWLGMSIVIAAIGLIQLVVGGTIFFRSPKDTIRVESQIGTEKIATEEIPRMKTVMKSFVLYRNIEIALIAIGFILVLYIGSQFWRGMGWGLIIKASVMLLGDFIAENRGKTYLQWLTNIADS